MIELRPGSEEGLEPGRVDEVGDEDLVDLVAVLVGLARVADLVGVRPPDHVRFRIEQIANIKGHSDRRGAIVGLRAT